MKKAKEIVQGNSGEPVRHATRSPEGSLFEWLPEEIIGELFKKLDQDAKRSLRTTCRKLRDKVDAFDAQNYQQDLETMHQNSKCLKLGMKFNFLQTPKGIFFRGENSPPKYSCVSETVDENSDCSIAMENQRGYFVAKDRLHRFYTCFDSDVGYMIPTLIDNDATRMHHIDIIDPPTLDEFFIDSAILRDQFGRSLIASGKKYTIAATNTGVYVWGVNTFGVCGRPTIGFDRTPQRIELFNDERILQIAAGGQHCLVLTEKGLYSWGCNTMGQAISANQSDNNYEARLVNYFADKKIQHIAAGSIHSVIIADDRLFTVGAVSASGQPFPFVPAAIANLEDVQVHKVLCGEGHNVLWTDRGLFVWGENVFGQLGIGAPSKPVQKLQKLDFFDDKIIKDVVVGPYNTAVMTDRQIYTFGYNLTGLLGQHPAPGLVAHPRPLFLSSIAEAPASVRVKSEVERGYYGFAEDDDEDGGAGVGAKRSLSTTGPRSFASRQP